MTNNAFAQVRNFLTREDIPTQVSSESSSTKGLESDTTGPFLKKNEFKGKKKFTSIMNNHNSLNCIKYIGKYVMP